jgi:molybdopterin synthase sulfur carrier subunit
VVDGLNGAAVTVRYYAGARAAAGLVEESARPGVVAQLRKELGARHDAKFEAVLASSTLLCDGRPLADDAMIGPGATVEVLPPFAGG